MKQKICAEPGCGKEFIGHPIRKYCDEHKDIKNRAGYKRKIIKYDTGTFILQPKFWDKKKIYWAKKRFKRPCDLCGKKYTLEVYPKQVMYPKYCEEHRNKFKRKNYLRKHSQVKE